MKSPESFDAFYVASRDRLLHEAYALTGDASASRAAVRDAFAVTWHHWRKVSRLEDPETWLRPVAHGRARRRHNALFWHRDKSLDPDNVATLRALAQLSHRQRQLLVLATLAPLDMGEIARTVGLPRAEAEREFQTASAQFALHRDVPTTEIRIRLDALAQPLHATSWPPASAVRRAGTARRRTHTLVGTAVATVVLLGSGSLVAAGAGAEPISLAEERTRLPVQLVAPPERPPEELVADALLDTDQVTRVAPGLTWREASTHDNLEGDGLAMPCQRERFADPDGVGSLVRTWKGARKGTRVRATAIQFVELSADTEQAELAFLRLRGWFAGCLDRRTQLLATRRVRGVGDQASQFTFRDWKRAGGGITADVARSGRLTVTTLVRTEAPATVRPPALMLAASVNGLCASPGSGTCAGEPRLTTVEPFAIGDPPGLLEPVDLPPVSNARGPWVGTPHVKARTNYAATRCDKTSFRAKGIRRAMTRTFLFPEAKRADQFGLTQTVGLMAPGRARSFVEGVRSRIGDCGEANPGITATRLVQRATAARDLTVWGLTIEVSDDRSVPFFMAVLRDRGTVSQIGFTPSGPMTMAQSDFVDVSERALERLSNLPRR